MLIVWVAYLYVAAMLAIATIVGGQPMLGSFVLVFGVILPTAMALWVMRRKQRARRARRAEYLASVAAEEPASTPPDDSSSTR
jgi:TRAP-type C4-dicarboxylate transport system permease small subunit